MPPLRNAAESARYEQRSVLAFQRSLAEDAEFWRNNTTGEPARALNCIRSTAQQTQPNICCVCAVPAGSAGKLTHSPSAADNFLGLAPFVDAVPFNNSLRPSRSTDWLL